MFTHKRQLGASLTAAAAAASMMFGSAAPASADGGYKLQLISLDCLKTEDASPHDEAYLTVNGIKVWEADVTSGNGPTSLNVEEDLHYFARIKLWDEDTGIFDKDDFLGQVIVTVDQVDKGVLEHTFNEDGAEYVLAYRVVKG